MKLKVDDILKLQGISKKELAERMGITPGSLSRLLSGGNPTMLTLSNIASSLNVSIGDLFDDEKKGKKISGYIEYNNKINKISSIEDFEKIHKLLKK